MTLASSCASRICLVVALAVLAPAHAVASLFVYEPFSYTTNTAPAVRLDLTSPYLTDAIHESFELWVTEPGLGYGNLVGAPASTGAKLTQLNGTIAVRAEAQLPTPISIMPGEAIYFSALFRFDDSQNGNHFASIDLFDHATGDSITFGESVVGIRTIRASAKTAVTGDQVTTIGDQNAFTDGQTLLLIGRYNNSVLPLGDRLELLGYDISATHELPATFEPGDPNSVLYQELSGVDIDLTRISALRFTIRGNDNNYIDELRIGSTLADVAAVPEPHTWLMLAFGIAAVTLAKRFLGRDPRISAERLG